VFGKNYTLYMRIQFPEKGVANYYFYSVDEDGKTKELSIAAAKSIYQDTISQWFTQYHNLVMRCTMNINDKNGRLRFKLTDVACSANKIYIPKLKWDKEFSDAHSTSPILIDKKDNVFFSYNHGYKFKGIETHGTFVSMSSSGEENWELSLDKSEYLLFNNGITLSDDGTLIVGTVGNYNKVPHRLFAINSCGKIEWQVETKYSIVFSAAVSDTGSIFFLTGEPALYSVDKKGNIEWLYRDDFEGEFCSSPVISNTGLIYVLCNSTFLYVFNQNGNRVNKIELEKAELYDSPFFDSEGTLYLPPNVTAIDFENNVKWVYTPKEGFIISNLFALYEKSLYCYANYFRLLSIDSKGMLRWETKMRGHAIYHPPVIGNCGIVYTCSVDVADGKDDSYIQAFSVQGKLIWEICINNESLIGIVIGKTNNLFALTNDLKNGKCKVYCFNIPE
jgi:outer membrane protein assembly factor BamB